MSKRIQPRTMRGALELLPRNQARFQHILDTIRGGFERFGFLAIETPVMERTDVLLSKEGGDTARQVYFVQSTGNRDKGTEPDLALRMDLTVPLARYVARHEKDLEFPFRRYQIQRVYRGERMQRGRFREFYQCDIDVVGKNTLSMRYDAEMPAVIHRIFTDLAIGDFTIRMNNRKLLRGLLEHLGVDDEETGTRTLREIDKLDKRGPQYVAEQLGSEGIGLDGSVVSGLLEFVGIEGSTDVVLASLDATKIANATFAAGMAEMRELVTTLDALGVPRSAFRIDPAIARGLDYYTGTVYEVFLDDHPELGSICSGGRYDDLASHYTKSRLPGVGLSIGITRLFWQLRELGLLHDGDVHQPVLVMRLDPALTDACLRVATSLRDAGVNTEVYLEDHAVKKQMKYAHRRRIRHAVLLGEDEHARGVVTVKDMKTGDQVEFPFAKIGKRVAKLRARLARG